MGFQCQEAMAYRPEAWTVSLPLSVRRRDFFDARSMALLLRGSDLGRAHTYRYNCGHCIKDVSIRQVVLCNIGFHVYHCLGFGSWIRLQH